jgi:hypothetical protein
VTVENVNVLALSSFYRYNFQRRTKFGVERIAWLDGGRRRHAVHLLSGPFNPDDRTFSGHNSVKWPSDGTNTKVHQTLSVWSPSLFREKGASVDDALLRWGNKKKIRPD